MKKKLSTGFLAFCFGIAIGLSSCTQDSELKPVEKEKTLKVIDPNAR